jgi:hypothetical protein
MITGKYASFPGVDVFFVNVFYPVENPEVKINILFQQVIPD